MPTPNPMKALYSKLATFGLPRAWVRQNLLPSWWDDEAALTDAGFSEALLHIARNSGLSITSLDAAAVPAEAAPASVRFKRRSDTEIGDLELARALSTQLARTVAAATVGLGQNPPAALELRDHLLETRSFIDLETLLAYCWSIGIPVLRATNFPAGTRKPDALAVDVGGRRVIVVTNGRTSAPWLLFLIAHELGHIACGHLERDTALVDADVDRDDVDAEEREANAWAVTLLSGSPDVAFRATSTWPNASQLAKEAQELGVRLQTDPGFIVLNYAYSMGNSFFAVANAALKLMPHTADGDAVIRRLAREKLDWSRLGEDAAEFTARMIGAAGDTEVAASVA